MFSKIQRLTPTTACNAMPVEGFDLEVKLYMYSYMILVAASNYFTTSKSVGEVQILPVVY
jgi:hypothetical protein